MKKLFLSSIMEEFVSVALDISFEAEKSMQISPCSRNTTYLSSHMLLLCKLRCKRASMSPMELLVSFFDFAALQP